MIGEEIWSTIIGKTISVAVQKHRIIDRNPAGILEKEQMHDAF
jgi:hypothetical protein